MREWVNQNVTFSYDKWILSKGTALTVQTQNQERTTDFGCDPVVTNQELEDCWGEERVLTKTMPLLRESRPLPHTSQTSDHPREKVRITRVALNLEN